MGKQAQLLINKVKHPTVLQRVSSHTSMYLLPTHYSGGTWTSTTLLCTVLIVCMVFTTFRLIDLVIDD